MTSQPILTRYLYDKLDVVHSWRRAIREGKRDEALFWTVELYESGFERDMFDYILDAYDPKQYPRLSKYVGARMAEYATTPDPLCIVASIVANFAHRPLSNPGIRESPIYIQIRRRDIAAYCAESHTDILLRKRLQYVCAYSVDTVRRRNNDTQYLGDWLYYAAHQTPLWQSRVAAYPSFRLNHTKQTATFENDDELEEFYEKHGLEPDEQPLWVSRIRGFFRCSGR